jgi:uncharacterized protein (TIGR02996 family)
MRKKAPALDAAAQKRDDELRALVEKHPGDADAVLVYADWLEERGDMQRARFLRLQEQIRPLKVSHPKLLERGKELYELGEKLPAEWVAAVTHPKIAGSVWDGKDDDGTLTLRFLDTGFVNYTQPSGTFENGKWTQIGLGVAMETNAHYADYFGVIAGEWMRGSAHNIVDAKWKWKVKRTSAPEIIAIPEVVNRRIHDDHVRSRREAAAKAKEKPAKPKKPRTKLVRKKPLQRRTKSKRA